MEDEASEVFQSQSLFEANVHQHSPIEGSSIGLLNNKDTVVYLLSIKQRMQIGQQHPQMYGTRSVRHHNGHCLFGKAAGWFSKTTRLQVWAQRFLQHIYRDVFFVHNYVALWRLIAIMIIE